ncbi:hypothetical protein RFI_18211 [Reticulomyxa filosa]|uniref:Uncharacterized protein n=1 Tax=Reticulomyxa filosa TaxID=46433 RepID=X6N124_RETFI|nr:hypothetical protein RFI_18211 [Reticulomyxa filosa]|eukprot:ETO19027.1 hypothetical protein RFI_18211 [Reticulomyxa filosa]
MTDKGAHDRKFHVVGVNNCGRDRVDTRSKNVKVGGEEEAEVNENENEDKDDKPKMDAQKVCWASGIQCIYLLLEKKVLGYCWILFLMIESKLLATTITSMTKMIHNTSARIITENSNQDWRLREVISRKRRSSENHFEDNVCRGHFTREAQVVKLLGLETLNATFQLKLLKSGSRIVFVSGEATNEWIPGAHDGMYNKTNTTTFMCSFFVFVVHYVFEVKRLISIKSGFGSNVRLPNEDQLSRLDQFWKWKLDDSDNEREENTTLNNRCKLKRGKKRTTQYIGKNMKGYYTYCIKDMSKAKFNIFAFFFFFLKKKRHGWWYICVECLIKWQSTKTAFKIQ